MNSHITEDLPRKLTLLDATMITAGSMIGSGIFIVPATIALYLQSSFPIILVWIVGGIVSLFGVMSVAELGAMMPRAGGIFVYLREAYSPLWGFLYGWAAFTVINTASIAAVAVTFATYMSYFFPMGGQETKLMAIASIVFLTTINCFGIKVGAGIQNVFTITKIGALLALAALSFMLSGGSTSNFSPVLPSMPMASLTGPFVLAMVAALWSYDGWIEITYVAGEVIDPQRNLPRSLAIGTIIVILLYILISCAVSYVLPIETAAHSQLVLSDTTVKIMGTGGAVFISLAVIISTFGTNNGFIFTCPRIYYAMAKEGLFFKWLGTVHPKYATPIPSLIAQAVLSSAFILSGTFDQFITYVVFASWLFYSMSAGAVFILRKRSPDVPRSYKTWGYPFTPILFILFAMGLVGFSIKESPRDSLIGLGIVLSGLPAYLYWKR
ncbi:MAG TPA: amino acid permease [Bacteroidota bacterium]|jgi:APA family basic amino acid/polyamine antiporter|nr:amino acid permease [Bacteroidota bacterium]